MAEENPFAKFKSDAGDNPFARFKAGAAPTPETTPNPDLPQRGVMPADRLLGDTAEAVVPAVTNLLDYPARALEANLYGVTQSGLPIDKASREKFYQAREGALRATEIPETEGGSRLRSALEWPGQMVGAGVQNAAKSVLGEQTAEALGPLGTVLGDVLPFGMAGRASGRAVTPRPEASAARAAGYKLPPEEIASSEGMTARALSGASGKIKKQQAFSELNQETTNTLATRALGLPAGTALTAAEFDRIRADAGRDYQAVATAQPTITGNPAYDTTVANLGGASAQFARLFPHIAKNEGIDKMVADLQRVPTMPTDVSLELVKKLRHDGNANLKARDDPGRLALGLAQRKAADAVDKLIEDNAIASGAAPDLVSRYREARTRIAKTYDVEAATNPATGDVNGRRIAALRSRLNRPLSGELAQIADAADAFPKQMQQPSAFGHVEDWSILDVLGATGATMAGHPGAAGMLLARPVARRALGTEHFQNQMFNRVPFWQSPSNSYLASVLAQPQDPVATALGR